MMQLSKTEALVIIVGAILTVAVISLESLGGMSTRKESIASKSFCSGNPIVVTAMDKYYLCKNYAPQARLGIKCKIKGSKDFYNMVQFPANEYVEVYVCPTAMQGMENSRGI